MKVYTYYVEYVIDTGTNFNIIKNVIVSEINISRDKAEKLVKSNLRYDEVLASFTFVPIHADEPKLLF